MIYFINSNNEVLLNHQLSKINKEQLTVVKYDLTRDNIISCCNKLIEYNLLQTKYLYVFNNIDFFTNKTSTFLKKHINFAIETLNKSIYDVVIITNKPLAVSSQPLQQLMSEYTYIDCTESDNNINEYIKSFLTQHQIEISTKNLQLLKQNLETDLNALTNELLKLSTYENPISSKTIKMLSYKSLTSNVFDLIELIVYDDYLKAKKLYNTLIKEGSEPVQLLGLIATQIKFIYQVKLLETRDNVFISKNLKANNYRVDITLKKYKIININKVEAIYKQVAFTDYKIKLGELPPNNIIDYILT